MRSKKEFNSEEFSDYIKYRFAKDFRTQKEAGEYFGVYQSTISLLESGKIQPNLDILIYLGYEKEIKYKKVWYE